MIIYRESDDRMILICFDIVLSVNDFYSVSSCKNAGIS